MRPTKAPTLAASFHFAFTGLFEVVRSERNMRIHILAGLLVVVLAWLLHVSRIEWLALVLAIALVMAAELFNRALEAAVDLATEEWQPLAKKAKDAAAGAVLVSAAGAVAIGLLVFVPRLARLLG